MMSGETPDNNDQCDEASRAPASSLGCSKADVTTLSSITDANLGSPINAGHQIKPFENTYDTKKRAGKISSDIVVNYIMYV